MVSQKFFSIFFSQNIVTNLQSAFRNYNSTFRERKDSLIALLEIIGTQKYIFNRIKVELACQTNHEISLFTNNL